MQLSHSWLFPDLDIHFAHLCGTGTQVHRWEERNKWVRQHKERSWYFGGKMGLRCSADNRLLRGTSVSAQLHSFFIYFHETWDMDTCSHLKHVGFKLILWFWLKFSSVWWCLSSIMHASFVLVDSWLLSSHLAIKQPIRHSEAQISSQ